MRKYYMKRYQLFSRFDDGVLLESKESWYSVTPEKVAEHIAQKCYRTLGCNSNLVVLGKCLCLRALASELALHGV